MRLQGTCVCVCVCNVRRLTLGAFFLLVRRAPICSVPLAVPYVCPSTDRPARISILKRKKDSISREVSAPINHPFPQPLARSALGRESSLARAARTGAPDRDDDAKMAVRERGGGGSRGTGREGGEGGQERVARSATKRLRRATEDEERDHAERTRERGRCGAVQENETESELSGARRSRRTGGSPCLRRELQ